MLYTRFRTFALPLFLGASLWLAGCSKSPAERYTAAMAKGQELLQTDPVRAALEFRNAVQAKPREAEAHYWLAQAYLRNDSVREAIAELRKANEVNPNYTPATVKLAELMVLTHNNDMAKEAESKLMAVLTADPSDADALYTMAAAEVRLGNAAEAEKLLGKVLDKAPKNLRSAVALAQLKGAQKDFNGAEQILKAAIARAPESAEAVVALGMLYMWAGRPADAKATLIHATQLDPKSATALVALAPLQMQSGDLAGAEATYKRVSSLPSREHRLYYAMFLTQQNRQADALKELERLVKADGNDRLARTSLVAGYVAANRKPEAIALLEKVLKANSKDADALVQRGEINLLDGKLGEAQRDLSEVLHYNPTGQAHYLMAKVYRERGAIPLQKQELYEALRLAPESLRVRIELANALILSRDPRAALEVLDATPERLKNRAGYVLARNWALMANGDQNARKNVDTTLGAAKMPETLLQDAVLKLRGGNTAGARENLEQILKADPSDLRALSTLVQIYSGQKQSNAALDKIKQSVAQRPKELKLRLYLATWLLENNREAEGRQALEEAKLVAPGNPKPDMLMAGWDIQTGKLDAARQRLTKLVTGDTGNIDAHMMLGDIEDTAEHHTQAVQHYRRVLDLDPNNVRAMNNMAFNMALDPTMLDDALKFGQRAKELAPQNPQIQDTLGWIYYRKEMYAQAAKELEAAHARMPSPMVKYHLGQTYKHIGRSEEGGQLVAAALAVEPGLADKGN